MRLTLLGIGLLFLFGCSHGAQMSTAFKPTDEKTASELVIIREGKFVGGGAKIYVGLDYQDVLAIGNGEHTNIKVDPGKHVITIKLPGNLSELTENASVEINCQPNTKNYALLWFSMGGANIKRIDGKEGEEYVKDTSYLEFKQ